MGIPRAQHDQRQRQAEGSALPQPQQNRPTPQAFERRVKATEQAAERHQHDDHDRRALIPAASGQPRGRQGTDQLNDHRPRQHQARLGRGQAATNQDRRQPPEHNVRQGRLQPHVGRDLPGQSIAQQTAHPISNVVGALFLADLR
ncbi:hypothetical protein D3C73_1228240 [compost metagenome]